MNKIKSFGTEIGRFIKESFALLGRYFASRLLICLILGIACYIVLWIVGIRLKLLISILVAVTTLVPYIGPIAAMVVTALIVVFQAPIYVLWMTIINFSLQLVDAWVLSPIIIGKNLGVPPILVIVAVIIGGSVFGILGIIFAVPAAAILALFMRKVRNAKSSDLDIDL